MFCRQCGSELKEGAAFCSKCGYKVVNRTDEKIEIPSPVIGTVCGKCGAPLNEGAAFCNACGASTTPAVETPVQAAASLEKSTPKVSSLCSKCGAPLKEGAAFCNACGASTAPAVETPVQAAVSLEKSTPKVSSLCSKCGAPLKEGAAFCNACGASTAPAADAPVQTEVPYEPPKEGQERVYTFKANQNGDTVFHFTHDTLVVNQSGNPDKSKITCVPYCVISQITYKTRKIFPAMLIVGGVVLLILLLMLGISSEDIMSYPGTSAEEGKLGMLVVHGIRIALAIMVVVCVMNSRRTELMIKSGTKYAYTFDVNPVKDDKEKEWEAMFNELNHLIHIKRTDEEKQNKTILTGIIAKDTKSNGMELLAHLQDNLKKREEGQVKA